MPLVSIVTPSFNCENFLADTVDSVRNQTFTDWELLIVDDKSTDRSFEIASRFAEEDARIHVWCLEVHGGPARARNEAISRAKGRFIAFIDSDDLWDSKKLEIQVSFMESHKADLSYSSIKKINETGGNTDRIVHAPPYVTYKKMLLTNYIACSSAMYDSEKLGKVYMPDILKRQDYGLWLEILRKEEVVALGVPDILVSYRVRGESVSSNKWRAAGYNWVLYRKVEKLSLVRALWCFLNYTIRGLLRRAN